MGVRGADVNLPDIWRPWVALELGPGDVGRLPQGCRLPPDVHGIIRIFLEALYNLLINLNILPDMDEQ